MVLLIFGNPNIDDRVNTCLKISVLNTLDLAQILNSFFEIICSCRLLRDNLKERLCTYLREAGTKKQPPL